MKSLAKLKQDEDLIRRALKTGDIAPAVDAISDYRGVPSGHQVIIYCVDCGAEFHRSDYRSHVKMAARMLEEPKPWMLAALRHFKDHPDHTIMTLGQDEEYCFSDCWRGLPEEDLDGEIKRLEAALT